MKTTSEMQENAYAAAALHEAGVALMRQNLRRRHSDANDEQIEALLVAWLCRVDDAIPGDVSGEVSVRELTR